MTFFNQIWHFARAGLEVEYYSWSGARGVSRYQGLLLRTAAARAAVLALYCVTVPAIMLSSTTVDIRKRQLEISLLFHTLRDLNTATPREVQRQQKRRWRLDRTDDQSQMNTANRRNARSLQNSKF